LPDLSIDFRECVDIFRRLVDHVTDDIDSQLPNASPQVKRSMAVVVSAAFSELSVGRGQLDGMPDATVEQLEQLGNVMGALVAGAQHAAHCPAGTDCPSYQAHEELRSTTAPPLLEALKDFAPREYIGKPAGQA
jgi:hypothetical protein